MQMSMIEQDLRGVVHDVWIANLVQILHTIGKQTNTLNL